MNNRDEKVKYWQIEITSTGADMRIRLWNGQKWLVFIEFKCCHNKNNSFLINYNVLS